MEEITRTEELVNEIFELEEKAFKIKERKKILNEELLSLVNITKKDGQSSKVIGDKRVVFRGRIRRTLNKGMLLKDYNRFDSSLRGCFPMTPSLDKKRYKEMLIINPLLIAQYVTESNPSYTISFKKLEKKENE